MVGGWLIVFTLTKTPHLIIQFMSLMDARQGKAKASLYGRLALYSDRNLPILDITQQHKWQLRLCHVIKKPYLWIVDGKRNAV